MSFLWPGFLITEPTELSSICRTERGGAGSEKCDRRVVQQSFSHFRYVCLSSSTCAQREWRRRRATTGLVPCFRELVHRRRVSPLVWEHRCRNDGPFPPLQAESDCGCLNLDGYHWTAE